MVPNETTQPKATELTHVHLYPSTVQYINDTQIQVIARDSHVLNEVIHSAYTARK